MKRHLAADIIDLLNKQPSRGASQRMSAGELADATGVSRPTLNRRLAKMVAEGQLIKSGRGPATVYGTPDAVMPIPSASAPAAAEPTRTGFAFDAGALARLSELRMPVASRTPVAYQRDFVDRYQPNTSTLLPAALADRLYAAGKAKTPLPAGNWALGPWLIDLCWHSSRLAGNRKSLLEAHELLARGRAGDDDADMIMVFNHKDALEFILEALPEYGIDTMVIRNIQSILMQNLLKDAGAVGAIRRQGLTLAATAYQPVQGAAQLEAMLNAIVEKLRRIRNPLEAAFFAWINIAYLYAFEEGNNRTSRLCANLPLFASNCAPLSFCDVDAADYALALTAVCERQDVSLAVDLFEWTYRVSIDKYTAETEPVRAAGPARGRFRQKLGDGVRLVVNNALTVFQAAATLGLAADEIGIFRNLLAGELNRLEVYNCSRYRLSFARTEDWVSSGRPGLE